MEEIRLAQQLVSDGKVAESSGDLKKSLELYQQARVLFHSHAEHQGEAQAVLGLARSCRDSREAMVSHLKEYVRIVGEDKLSDEERAWIFYELGYSGFVTGDFGTALRHLQAARLSAKLSGKKMLEAWSLLYLGSLYGRRGEPEKGVQMMQRAVNLMGAAGNTKDQQKALIMTAELQHEIGKLDDAIATYSNATILARDAKDIKAEARIYRCVGSVLRDKGDARSALHSFKVAVQLSDQCSDKLGLVSSSLLVGNTIDTLAPGSTEAVAYWKQALKACKEIQADVKTLLPLRSEALFRLIQHNEKQRLYSVVLTYRLELLQLMKDAGLQRGYATTLLDVAEMQSRLGRAVEAGASFGEASALWRNFGDKVNEAVAHTGWASSLLQRGLIHDAREHADIARGLLEGLPSKEQSLARARALVGAAELLARTGEIATAKSLASRALLISDTPQGDKDVTCGAQLALARVSLEEADVDNAKKLTTTALSHAVSAQLFPQMYQGLELLGDICLRNKDLTKASEYFDKMARLTEKSGLAWTRGPALQRLAEVEELKGNKQKAVRIHMEAVGLLEGEQQQQRAFKSLSALSRLHGSLGNAETAESFARMAKLLSTDESVSRKQ